MVTNKEHFELNIMDYSTIPYCVVELVFGREWTANRLDLQIL